MSKLWRYFASWKGISRMWFYFRIGYGTYLTFVLGLLTTTVTVYYLAVKNVPFLMIVFPTFTPFLVLAVLLGVPLGILAGWLHMKRSRFYESEQDISVESSPYYYKLPPGYSRNVYAPMYMHMLGILAKLGEKNDLLSEKDRAEIEQLKAKLKILREGEFA